MGDEQWFYRGEHEWAALAERLKLISCPHSGRPPTKIRDGRFWFLCPHCGDMLATVNPRNNLAHCFNCQKNLNNIDLLMTVGYDFPTAVTVLENLLQRYEARLPKQNTPIPK